MSYDRVLPRPPALYYDPPWRDSSTCTSTPLEHKVSGEYSMVNVARTDGVPSSNLGIRTRLPTTSDAPSAPGGRMISSRNRSITEVSAVLASPAPQRANFSPVTSESSQEERSKIPRSSTDSGIRFCLCRSSPKIPRPRNCFILFRQCLHPEIVAQYPGMSNPQISRIIGDKWKNLSAEKKQEWKDTAEDEKVRHKQQHPGYRYQPRRSGRRSSRTTVGSGLMKTTSGASVCNQCGGRMMNPPSTPTTLLAADSAPSAGTKRRRSEDSNTYLPIQANTSPNSPYSPRTQAIPIPEVPNGKAPYMMEPTSKLHQITGAQQTTRCTGITLPPLQTMSFSQQYQSDVEDMDMTISVLDKIKILSLSSPPLTSSPPDRGAIISVEGQHSDSVECVIDYLHSLLSKTHVVQGWRGPEPHPRQLKQSCNGADRTAQFLGYHHAILTWLNISSEILNFIKTGYKEKPQSGMSQGSIMSKSANMQIANPDNTATTVQPIDAHFPIALVPRYQLTTTDAYACRTPIKDSYTPSDHWRWMASLWRGCVGPDITIHIRDCEEEELKKLGGGNPVENRLNDARALIIRRLADSSMAIEERALRRVAFEVEEFLKK